MRIRNRTGTVFTLTVITAAIAVSLCGCGPGPADAGSTGTSAQVSTSAAGNEAANGSGSPAQTSPAAVTGSPADSGSPAPSTGDQSQSANGNNPQSSSSSGSQQSAPFDFELDQGFTSFSPDDQIAATEEENAFKHVLFEINPGGTSYVIDGNLSSTPVEATVTPGSDGSLNISYYEQAGGAATTSIQFDGALSSQGTMNARAIVDQAGGTVASDTEYFGASSGTYYFTGLAAKVSPDDLPDPPSGTGQCGWTSDYGIWLTWGAPSDGPAPSSYDIYEFVAEVNPPIFYLGRVSTTGVTDNSETTRENDASIISYTVYSVGSTGLESLTGETVTVDGVMPGSPPSCSIS